MVGALPTLHVSGELDLASVATFRDAAVRLIADATGATVAIEDTSRVDPWFVGQVARLRAECEERLRLFARDEGAIP